ncbi:MAG TPA: hypothetical protein VJX95_04115 [Oscillospiraceae bacterium]|nr:hypothetical protein [Oscillospiraceae bacterium]
MKKLLCLLCVLIIGVTSFSTAVSADLPYHGYNYDWWGMPVPSQNGYVPDLVVTGEQIGVGTFKEAQDLFISDDELFYIADSGNNRIVVTDKDFNLIRVIDTLIEEDGTETTFNNPMGVFVDHKNNLYIADTNNERVILADADLNVIRYFHKPESEVYPADITYNPRKVTVDKAGTMFVVVKSVNQGAVTFSPDGTFKGFYGANRVQTTADVIANAFWKTVLSPEAARKRKRSVAVEIANFDIDEDGFVYTVTEAKSLDTDVLKKLSPSGKNIYETLGYSDYFYGDWGSVYYLGQTITSSIVDVDVGDYGIINLVDYTSKRIFQYNRECDLLFVFGGEGDQVGTFRAPNAVESLGESVYVLDGRKNSITRFNRTIFGEYVHTAVELTVLGRYEEAVAPWEEVLRRDGNYWYAYIGLGNAYLEQGEYETAMDYFYYNSRGGYSRAFKYYRMDFLRENFNKIVIGFVVLFVLYFIIKRVIKRVRLNKKNNGMGVE